MADPSPTAPLPTAAYRRWLAAQRRDGIVVHVIQVLIVVVFFVVWEIAARSHWVNPLFTSYPTAVWAGFAAMVAEGELLHHVLVTIVEIVVSFVLSTLVGLALAVLLWLTPMLRRVMAPFIVVVNAIPKIALVPIFYIWLGPVLSIYMIAVSVSIFIVLIMMSAGFEQTDPNKIKLARTFGCTQWQLLTKVVLPANMPTLISVLKGNVGLSLVGVIVGEFQSAKAGLGYLITYGSQTFQMDRVIASVTILAVISVFTYFAIVAFEKALARYT
ncbi:MAG: ABC transporter permease [Burkholderiaceae bacterium]